MDGHESDWKIHVLPGRKDDYKDGECIAEWDAETDVRREMNLYSAANARRH